MTTSATEADREARRAAGTDDHVSQPMRPDELARALRGAAVHDESLAEAPA